MLPLEQSADVQLAGCVGGVDLCDLPPFTTLLVRTVNSVYRVVTTDHPGVYVQGGRFLHDPTPAYIDAACAGGHCRRREWIAVGRLMDIRWGLGRIVTSPVQAIAAERLSRSVVH